MRESKIEQYFVDVVVYLGGEIRKLQWIGCNGVPDRVVMLNGLRVGIHRFVFRKVF
jgi:hypothetical protein